MNLVAYGKILSAFSVEDKLDMQLVHSQLVLPEIRNSKREPNVSYLLTVLSEPDSWPVVFFRTLNNKSRFVHGV